MQPVPAPSQPPTLRRVFAWRRVRTVLVTCVVLSVLMLPTWEAPYRLLIGRLLMVGAMVLAVFGLFERWPARLPAWLARWALQVAAVALTVPLGVALAYALTTMGDAQPWFLNEKRQAGFLFMSILGLLATPWITVSALFGQIKDEARSQALAFELERSELERKALDARLRLLQARVEPHFLFNTLANVRELVVTGSSQAPRVLDSLIAYLRAAVPRLHEPESTIGQELELVRAYLEVMHIRMPDRLAFAIDAGDAAGAVLCPPMAILTLVENAVRHGIDPCEDGGRIDIRVGVEGERCLVQVSDTGAGPGRGTPGLGTGLTNLRERLQLAFGEAATLEILSGEARGTVARIAFPAKRRSA